MYNKVFYEHNGIKIYNVHDQSGEISKFYYSPRRKGSELDTDTIDIRKYMFINNPTDNEIKETLKKIIDEGYL